MKHIPGLTEMKEGIPAFALREVSVLRSISHPNIIKLLDTIVTEGRLTLVFEFLPSSLANYIMRVGPLKPELVRSYAFQILSAIHALHAHGVLHRDLKPANIMLNNDGYLKVIDFGMARFFRPPIQQYSPLVQTITYRAPEIVFQVRPYHTAIDLWSVGVIIAEMSRGGPLFIADSTIKLADKMVELLGTPQDTESSFIPESLVIREREARPWPEILNSEDIYLCDLVAKLLCYNPSKRISAHDAMQHPYFDDLPEGVRKMCETTERPTIS
jgi:serine/threonine protein kinase